MEKMGKGSGHVFLQRRYTYGQRAQEKMINIISHYRNANQKHNDKTSYSLGWLKLKDRW